MPKNKFTSTLPMKQNKWFYRVAYSLIIIAIVFLWYYIPKLLTCDLMGLEQKGVYGDSFGSVNALFTGLAFAGVLITILFQIKSSKEQGEHLQEQLNEMKQSSSEIRIQSDLMERHNAMLNIQNNLLEQQTHEMSHQNQLKFYELETRANEIEMQRYILKAQAWTPGSNNYNSITDSIGKLATNTRDNLERIRKTLEKLNKDD